MKSKLLLLLAAGLFAAVVGYADAQDTSQKVGVCDPTPYVHNCIKPNSDGSININGGGGGGGVVTQPTASLLNAAVVGTGTAGTPAGNLLTIQGSPSGSAVPVVSGIIAGTSATGQTYAPTAGLSQTACNAATNTTAQLNPPNLDLKGNACVNLLANTGVAGTANANALTVQGIAGMTKLLVTPDSVALPANQSINTAQVNGVTTLTGTGATGTGAQRVTVATDSATVAGSASLPTGANVIGKTGIDQTTQGTTNGVQALNFPTPVATGTGAQSASTPRFTIATDSATVAGSASLPAGTNVVGVVGNTQGSTTSGQSGPLVQGAVLTANPALTTAQTNPLSLTITGALREKNAPGTIESCASGNVAAAVAACTLATSAGHTTYITGFSMTASGATAALPVTCTLTGPITGTKSYTFGFPAGVLVGATPLNVTFNPPLPASAANTTIVASCPSGGTGNTNATMTAEGFQE